MAQRVQREEQAVDEAEGKPDAEQNLALQLRGEQFDAEHFVQPVRHVDDDLALGAHQVLDYRRDDFTQRGPYDLVLDLVASRPVLALRRSLAPGGRYFCVGGSTGALLRVLTVGTVVGALTGRRLSVLAVRQGPAAFEPVAALCVGGSIDVVIDRTYPLEETARALAHVGAGRARGKVVVEPRRSSPVPGT